MRWLLRHVRAVALATVALVGASAYLAAFHLPLYADLSDLLPRDVPAIRDLRALEARLAWKDAMLAVVVDDDPADRAAVAHELAVRVAALDGDLVARVQADDDASRAFARAHAGLYVPIDQLEAADRALEARLALARLGVAAPAGELDALRARRQELDDRLARSAFVSADGHLQAVVVETAFRATDAARDRRLQGDLDAIAAPLRAAHPHATIAFCGGIPQTLAEHDALVHGMVISSVVTGALVALVLLVHLRSVRVLALLVANIVAATLVAFGIAAVTVGHLNAATAFLGAIIAGNGVNYGILLVARYLDERRRACDAGPVGAMARAVAGTLRPTLVASLGAAIAYGALAATHFTGFTDFAVIGGVGMLVCWLASFTVLPVLVLRAAPHATADRASPFGRVVQRVFGGRRPALVCAVAGAIALASTTIAVRYIAADPFEYDMTRLRSDAPDALALRGWMDRVNATLGRGLAGISRSTYIAVDDVAQIPAVVSALHAAHERDRIVGPTLSILDAVPPDQDAKLRVLARLRADIDTAEQLVPADERAELAAMRPADDLRAVTVADLPPELRAKLTERDGRVGTLVAVTPGPSFDEWNGHDLIRFATAVRSLELPGGGTVTTSGASVIFADILTTIRHDGVVVTVVAAVALTAMVLVVVGRDRRAAAVLAATGLGSLAMVAACAVAGLKINFLDFVALPIALGIGIDYAINMAHGCADGDALRTTGGSVLVCSLTTLIGYASLLVSSSIAIRGFGLASLIGEVTAVLAALALVPAIVTGRRA
nr:MMPL family transporter [Kofleriaceae bacterium]